MDSGALLELAIERPAVGGLMIARHDGRVILVSGAIPGERVRARVAHSRRGVPVASTEEVILTMTAVLCYAIPPAAGMCFPILHIRDNSH